ncbi:hypothetical protein [Actinomycetospora chibensis]|uniref:DNA ligase (ATP) n=1 Tax=Actinomycetospora chibensis TaxID=663606 RepID=A0ABV9RAQ8_9PSEU
MAVPRPQGRGAACRSRRLRRSGPSASGSAAPPSSSDADDPGHDEALPPAARGPRPRARSPRKARRHRHGRECAGERYRPTPSSSAPYAPTESPFIGVVPEECAARWCVPRLVGEARIRSWTDDGHLRHSSWRVLQPDRNPAELGQPHDRQGARLIADGRSSGTGWLSAASSSA